MSSSPMSQEPMPVTFGIPSQIHRVHNLTSLSSGWPVNPLRRFRTAIVAIAVLVSRVAEPMCGTSTQLTRLLLEKAVMQLLFRLAYRGS